MCVDICRTIFIDGQCKRCYADGGTGQHGSERNKEKQGKTRYYKKNILNCGVLLFIFFYPYSKV